MADKWGETSLERRLRMLDERHARMLDDSILGMFDGCKVFVTDPEDMPKDSLLTKLKNKIMFNSRVEELAKTITSLDKHYDKRTEKMVDRLDKLEKDKAESTERNFELVKVLLQKTKQHLYKLSESKGTPFYLYDMRIGDCGSNDKSRYVKLITIYDLQKLGKYETVKVGDTTYIISSKALK